MSAGPTETSSINHSQRVMRPMANLRKTECRLPDGFRLNHEASIADFYA